jgi:Leucine-rich repeat (LRR) protein
MAKDSIFCTSARTIYRSSNIASTMLDVCEDLNDNMKFVKTLNSKCKYSINYIRSYWHSDTGEWNYWGGLNCSNKSLTNADLDTFKVLKKVTDTNYPLNLSDNQLTNVDGLQNLTLVGYYLSLTNNQLTDISGIANINTPRLYLYNNPNLKDISPLANNDNIPTLYVENSDNAYTTKMAKDSIFCTSARTIYRNNNIASTMLDVCEQ